jgi:predicted flavoprotein YhiN
MGCNVTNSPLEFHWWPPGPYISNLSLDADCSTLNTKINVSQISISLGGFSFSPFGPVINTNFLLEKIPLQAKITLGFSEFGLAILGSQLKLDNFSSLLQKILSNKIQLQGNLNLDLRMTFTKNGLDNSNIVATSSNFNLPEQNISLFALPAIDAGTLNLSIKGKKNVFAIEKFILGSDTAPFYLNANGSIGIDQQDPTPQLNLKTLLKLDAEMEKKLSFATGFLGSYKINSAYEFNLVGPLSAPEIQAINPSN